MFSRANARVAALLRQLNGTGAACTAIGHKVACNATSASSTPPAQGLLHGRVAIITGSGAGIGEAATKLFAREGAYVVVTDLDRAKCLAVTESINSEHTHSVPPRALAVPGDVTDEAFPAELVRRTIERYGGVDILVNNAGYTWDSVIHKTSKKQWDAMLLVHCTAPFRLLQAVEPHMRGAAKIELESGRKPRPRVVINVSSTSGIHGNAGQANYATAKMGVLGLTKTVAKEWGAFNVRCCCIAFGYVQTRLTAKRDKESISLGDGTRVPLGIPGMNFEDVAKTTVPLQRMGTVEEAAGSMLMLASDHAGYINGICLEVTGGLGI